MKTGFYRLGADVYYGQYPEDQASGWMLLESLPPERLKTDRPFAKGEKANLLLHNHKLTEREQKELPAALRQIGDCLRAEEFPEIDFAPTERRLGLSLPEEIKTLYRALARFPAAMAGKERFLPLEQLELDQGNLIFYKIRRTPVGLSLKRGTLMGYRKKTWSDNPGGENFLCFALDRLVVRSIAAMPFRGQGQIKGKLRTTLRPEDILREIYGEKFRILESYRNYGNFILLSPEGALGWFRQNGFYADLLIGSCGEALLKELQPPELEINWAPANREG